MGNNIPRYPSQNGRCLLVYVRVSRLFAFFFVLFMMSAALQFYRILSISNLLQTQTSWHLATKETSINRLALMDRKTYENPTIRLLCSSERPIYSYGLA